MHWAVVAPFFDEKARRRDGARWVDDFVPSSQHTFEKIYLRVDEPVWHNRSWRRSTLSAWLVYLTSVLQAFKSSRADGVITVFPPMAILAAAMKCYPPFRNQKIVAWCFNIGRMPPKYLDSLIGYLLRKIDRIVVHSAAERNLLIKRYLLDPNKVSFKYLQTSLSGCESSASRSNDSYILSMGSANRDYKTLSKALNGLSIPCIVVANRSTLKGVQFLDNVKVLSNLTHAHCRELLNQCLFSIVPLHDSGTASGQITIIESLSIGRPVIATRTMGTVDYIDDEHTGLLVSPYGHRELRRAIDRLVGDDALRKVMSERAKLFAERNFSDETAGNNLLEILNSLI